MDLSFSKTPQRCRGGRRVYLTPTKTPLVRTPPPKGGHGMRSAGRFSGRSLTPMSLTPTKTTPSHGMGGDRFIPSRRNLQLHLCRNLLKEGRKRGHDTDDSSSPQRQKHEHETPLQKEFKRRIMSTMCDIPLDRLDEDGKPRSIFSYDYSGSSSIVERKEPMNPFTLDTLRTMKLGGENQDPASQQSVANKVVRKVASAPIRILDAPDIVDDYYLNLVSWSKDNILAVALARSVYLWNAFTGEIQHLVSVEEPNNYITSVSWCTMPGHTHYIAVGTNTAYVHIYDGSQLRKIRTLMGHSSRVSALAWTQNKLTSGARDSLVLNHDIRMQTNVVATYKAHTQEVCGLKWNDDGSCLASGGNENYLCLWDAAMSNQGRRAFESSQHQEHRPRLILRQHKAAVKALDWCPFHRGLLASGGGTADRTIKFWNTSSGAMLNSVDTGSQVCSIIWSKTQRELCSSHGYSENQLVLWKYPTMTKIKELTGHTARVLNMEMSPDGTSVVSAGADETLRFWSVFEECRGGGQSSNMLMGDMFGGPTIR